MNQLPRLALATPEMGSRPSLAALAWLAGLSQKHRKVQHSRARACPTGSELVRGLTGLPCRHLDSWLMPEDLIRTFFTRSARLADLSIVEGSYNPLSNTDCLQGHPSGGLRPIVDALDLPVVAILPAPDLKHFHLPYVPPEADAIFIDQLENPEDFPAIKRMFALTTKKPVVGALEKLNDVEALLQTAPLDQAQTRWLYSVLATSFHRFADFGTIDQLARSRTHSWTIPEPSLRCSLPFRVAYAQDNAFGEYFPDTLEALEALGAELVEFSPIHDERLPSNVDLVMIGCGYPDRFVDKIVNNHSMIAEIQGHVCRGKRIYAEGGGAAYLGRFMVIHGATVPGAGILPFDAELLENPTPPSPVVRVFKTNTWLGPAGTEVRGYHSGRWRFHPDSAVLGCCSSFGALTEENDFYYRHHAVGGLMHLHLGALSQVVAAFAGEHSASLSLPSARPAR